MECKHEQINAKVKITRLTDSEAPDAKVTGFTADIQIVCMQCGRHFKFIGLPGGYSPFKPMVNLDETELRAPIEISDRKYEQDYSLFG